MFLRGSWSGGDGSWQGWLEARAEHEHGAWIIGLRLGKKEPERIRAPEKVASGEQGVGLLCLSPQLVQDPSIQTQKGSVIAAKPTSECRGTPALWSSGRWRLASHLLTLSPSRQASATWTVLFFHNFEFDSASRPLQSGLLWLQTSSPAPTSPASASQPRLTDPFLRVCSWLPQQLSLNRLALFSHSLHILSSTASFLPVSCSRLYVPQGQGRCDAGLWCLLKHKPIVRTQEPPHPVLSPTKVLFLSQDYGLFKEGPAYQGS